MMSLQIRMWVLVALMFAILYGVITAIGVYLGAGNILLYALLAAAFVGVQYLVGTGLVSLMMRVRWVSEQEEPELHQMVSDLATRADIPKPRVGVAHISLPNAFAYGRSLKDGRVCVTDGLQRLLSKEEIRAVLGHEISHLKHRDMLFLTVLSVIPLILYWLSWSLIWGGAYGRRRGSSGYAALIGLASFGLYLATNLLVLYASRIREYYADEGSVSLGNPPHQLDSALYRLVYGAARQQRTRGGNDELRRVQAVRAFFLSDVAHTTRDISDLRDIDQDLSGTIEPGELASLRLRNVRPSGTQRLLELFTTHPNMLKRIKRLAALP